MFTLIFLIKVYVTCANMEWFVWWPSADITVVCVQAAQGDTHQVLSLHVWMMNIASLRDMLLVLLLKPERWWVSRWWKCVSYFSEIVTTVLFVDCILDVYCHLNWCNLSLDVGLAMRSLQYNLKFRILKLFISCICLHSCLDTQHNMPYQDTVLSGTRLH